jgi:Putative  PD-(D/E)XK family member, (DUF4420)
MPLEFPPRRPTDIAGEAIWIFCKLKYGFAGLDSGGKMTAIFPLEGKLPVVGRSTGSLRIDYRGDVHIHMSDLDEVRNCCIVTCSDFSLERSFSALAEALARDLAAKPVATTRDFGHAFARWEQLFQKRRRLSLEEEQGLWGELYFLSTCASLEKAIACWRGPNAEEYDFLIDGVAFEVKASRRQGRHYVSHAQVSQAVKPATIFLISLWVGEDAANGLALPKMVELIATRTQDPIDFEEKLLSTRYSRADQDLYNRPFAALGPPLIYDMFSIPRVRQMDPGVLSLSYQVQLDLKAQLPEDDRGVIFARSFS